MRHEKVPAAGGTVAFRSYILPRAICKASSMTAGDIGRHAAELRLKLGLTSAEVATKASLDAADVERFESTGEGSVEMLVLLHRALSGDESLTQIFAVPRFDDIDEVIAFERRRLAKG